MTTARDIANQIDYARKEGMSMGMEKGMERGIGKQREETAKRMLSKGFSRKEIIDLTGISSDELQVLS